MSPRNSAAWVICLILVLTPWAAGAGEGGILSFYQKVISSADGDRCPMTPSCSQYAVQAIKKHGPVIGWIMAMDRIARCGRDTVKLVPKVTINGETRFWDPVEDNDFWWFQEKKQEKKK